MKWKGHKEIQSCKLLDHVEVLELDPMGKREWERDEGEIAAEARVATRSHCASDATL